MSKTLGFACKYCFTVYSTGALKRGCENKLERPVMVPLGAVFKSPDRVLGVIYDRTLEPQTHQWMYHVAPLSPEAPGIIARIDEKEKEFFEKVQPVTDEEFRYACSTLEARLYEEARLERDNNTCNLCKAKYNYSDLIADHIFAIALGGDESDINNLQTLCRDCNKKKTKDDMGKIAILRKQIKHGVLKGYEL